MVFTLFWASLALVFYTYFGYPLLIFTAARLFNRPVKKEEILPSVSILIAAYNEAQNIKAKIETCLQLDYPQEKLEILVGSDASDDGTDVVVQGFADARVKLIRLPERSGKVTVLNHLAREAKNELLFFTDARQKLDPQSLKILTAQFADPEVGSASGELILVEKDSGSYGEGVGLYWKYEKAIRKAESSFSSMLGATGAIYVLRRELFVPAPADTLLDDMYYPLWAVAKGYRAIFVEEARAFDRVSSSPAEEMRRKIRTLAGNFQIFSQLKGLLIPFKSPIAWQLISHKLLRVVQPYFLMMLFSTNYYLTSRAYRVFFIGQTVFYLLALGGYFLRNTRLNFRLLNLSLTFCTLNLAALLGGFRYFLGKQNVTWK